MILRTLLFGIVFFLGINSIQSQSGISIKMLSGVDIPSADQPEHFYFPSVGLRSGSELAYEWNLCNNISLGLAAQVNAIWSSYDEQKGIEAAESMANLYKFGSEQVIFSSHNSPQIQTLIGPRFNYTLGKLHLNAWYSFGSISGMPAMANAIINEGDREFNLMTFDHADNGKSTQFGASLGLSLSPSITLGFDLAMNQSRFKTDSYRYDVEQGNQAVASTLLHDNLFAGISIKVKPCLTNGSQRKNDNPLYQGSSKEGGNPLYEGIAEGNGSGENNDDGIEQGGTRAQDYNSSRSNRGGRALANNHNTTRSNKTQPMSGDDDGDGMDNGTRAQDYNSSRSNRGEKSAPANHNSTRSNKTKPVNGDIDSDDVDQGGNRAHDYNSSRSNRGERSTPANHNSTRSNKTKPVNGDIDGDDVDQGGTRAQDYNSSRSNRGESAVDPDSGNKSSTATDYNSSRSNKQGIVAKDVVDALDKATPQLVSTLVKELDKSTPLLARSLVKELDKSSPQLARNVSNNINDQQEQIARTIAATLNDAIPGLTESTIRELDKSSTKLAESKIRESDKSSTKQAHSPIRELDKSSTKMSTHISDAFDNSQEDVLRIVVKELDKSSPLIAKYLSSGGADVLEVQRQLSKHLDKATPKIAEVLIRELDKASPKIAESIN